MSIGDELKKIFYVIVEDISDDQEDAQSSSAETDDNTSLQSLSDFLTADGNFTRSSVSSLLLNFRCGSNSRYSFTQIPPYRAGKRRRVSNDISNILQTSLQDVVDDLRSASTMICHEIEQTRALGELLRGVPRVHDAWLRVAEDAVNKLQEMESGDNHRSLLDQEFSCMVCLELPAEAYLCGECSNILCHICKERSLLVSYRSCPTCKKEQAEWIKCPKIIRLLDKFVEWGIFRRETGGSGIVDGPQEENIIDD